MPPMKLAESKPGGWNSGDPVSGGLVVVPGVWISGSFVDGLGGSLVVGCGGSLVVIFGALHVPVVL